MSEDEKRTDIVKKDQTNLVDNFEGWEDGVEGADRAPASSKAPSSNSPTRPNG